MCPSMHLGKGVCTGWWGGDVQPPPPPPETATEASSTRPTGMHSCSFNMYGMGVLGKGSIDLLKAVDFTSPRTSSGQASWPCETVPNGTISISIQISKQRG